MNCLCSNPRDRTKPPPISTLHALAFSNPLVSSPPLQQHRFYNKANPTQRTARGQHVECDAKLFQTECGTFAAAVVVFLLCPIVVLLLHRLVLPALRHRFARSALMPLLHNGLQRCLVLGVRIPFAQQPALQYVQQGTVERLQIGVVPAHDARQKVCPAGAGGDAHVCALYIFLARSKWSAGFGNMENVISAAATHSLGVLLQHVQARESIRAHVTLRHQFIV